MDAFRPIRLPRFELGILQKNPTISTPISHGSPSDCIDDQSWKKGTDTCAHYAIEGYDCNDVGDNGVSAKDACRVSCNTCPPDIPLVKGHSYDRLPNPIQSDDESADESMILQSGWKMGDYDPSVRAPEHNELTMQMFSKMDELNKSIVSFQNIVTNSTDLIERGIDPPDIMSSAPNSTNSSNSSNSSTSSNSSDSSVSTGSGATDVSTTRKQFIITYQGYINNEDGVPQTELADDVYRMIINEIDITDDEDSVISEIKLRVSDELDISPSDITVIDVTRGSIQLKVFVPSYISTSSIQSLLTTQSFTLTHPVEGNTNTITMTPSSIKDIQTVTSDPLESSLPSGEPMLTLQDNIWKMLGVYVLVSVCAVLMSYLTDMGLIWKFKAGMFAILPILYVLMNYIGYDSNTGTTSVRINIMWIFTLVMTLVIYFVMRSVKLKSAVYGEYYKEASKISIVGASTLMTLLLSQGTAIAGLLGL